MGNSKERLADGIAGRIDAASDRLEQRLKKNQALLEDMSGEKMAGPIAVWCKQKIRRQ